MNAMYNVVMLLVAFALLVNSGPARALSETDERIESWVARQKMQLKRSWSPSMGKMFAG